jgi:hypothetical protein
VEQSGVVRPWDYYFQNWTWATGGTATDRFEPAEGYWVAPNPAGGVPWNVPTGFVFNADAFSPRVSTWSATSLAHAVVHSFHGEYWGNWQFPVASLDLPSSTIHFGPGGWQEARGWATGGALFVDNVLEELDSPGEWYYNVETQRLYLWYNATAGTPPPSGAVSLAQQEVLMQVAGNVTSPVVGLTISGITFTGAQPTYLSHKFTMPSGGDWSFGDVAALYAEGTEGLTVSGCNLTRLGGNAVLLRGWHRSAVISNNTFDRLGDNAVVLAGRAQYADLSAMTVPVGTVVDGNVFSALGIYVKQAGAVYTALHANTTISRNVAFNLPRAAVNINDGAHGGHTIVRNVFFNTVQATADHGAINSWEREPYAQVWNGSWPTFTPAPSTCDSNFIINSYYGIHSLDHDDGSNAWVDNGNVIAFAGVKNYQGFNKKTSSMFVRPDFIDGGHPQPMEGVRYTSVQHTEDGGFAIRSSTVAGVPLPVFYYFPACVRSLGQAAWGRALADMYTGNVCVLNSTSPFIYGKCTPTAPGADGYVPLAANNTYYTAGGAWQMSCGGKSLSLAAAQAVGYEIGSTVQDSNLSSSAIAGMIRQFLGYA